MEKPLICDGDLNGENLLGGQNLLSTTVGGPGHAAWSSPPPTGAGTCSDQTSGMDNTINTEPNQVMGLFVCLRGCRHASEGTDVPSAAGMPPHLARSGDRVVRRSLG